MTDAPGGEPAADPAVRAVALLGDEVRRRLYEFVRATRGPVTAQEQELEQAWRDELMVRQKFPPAEG